VPADWVRDAAGGSMLSVHVRPGARRSEIAGLHGDALCVRVRARPVEGAANREVLEVLAQALGMRPSALRIGSGGHGRDKKIVVEGLAADAVRERLGFVDKGSSGA
jgi:uncharacterized protein (TIGR00251 family)